LLVWGRIVNGQPVLEPAYEIMARASFPAPGADRIAMLDDAGSEIAGVSFDAGRIADLPGDQETFAFAVPISMLRGRSLAALRLTSGGRSVTNVRGADIAADAAAVVTRAGPRTAR